MRKLPTDSVVLIMLQFGAPIVSAGCLATHFGFTWYLFFGIWAAIWSLMPQVRI